MRHLHILMLMLLAVLTACGNDEEFVINCEIRGLGSTGVDMYYTTRSMQHASFHPVDGKVSLTGVSAEPTLVEVFTVDGEPLFACVARNGDELEVKMDLDKPGVMKIKGNDESEEYARFVTENDSLLRSGDVAAINALVAEEVLANPGRISSAMLLVTRFDARGHELEADSLLNVIKAEARPSWVVGAYPGMVGEQVSATARGPVKPITIYCGRQNDRDTTLRYWPSNQSYSMIVVTGVGKADSIRDVLKTLTKKLPARRFRAIEVAVMGDSAMWRQSISRDSAKWMQGWVPGGVAGTAVRALQIPAVPFFIVADSMGRQVYRGYSVSVADDSVRARLDRFVNPSSDDAGGDGATEADAVAKSPAAEPAHAAPAPVARPARPQRVVKPLPKGQLQRAVDDAEVDESADRVQTAPLKRIPQRPVTQ